MELSFYGDISKVDESQRMVFGYASTTALDSQGDVITKEALSNALLPYMEFANLREMHQPSAVGVAKTAELDDKGIYISAKVVDEQAWEKVKEGVYKGFSIGGKSLLKKGNSIEQLSISEISLVDRPANPECRIEIYKADLSPELTAAIIRKVEERNAEETPAAASEEKKETEQETEQTRAAVVEAVEEKAAATNDIQKGMYAVSQLACVIDALNDLKQNTAWEASYEGDGSAVPAKLKDAVNNLGDILKDMVAEETQELTASDDVEAEVVAYSAGTDDVEKAGARNSKADSSNIQKMHDMSMELGASCGGADASKLNTETDSESGIKKMADLQKTVTTLETENTELKKKITAWENLPQPSKIISKAIAISKKEDTGNAEPPIDAAKMNDPKELLKMAQANPMPLTDFLRT